MKVVKAGAVQMMGCGPQTSWCWRRPRGLLCRANRRFQLVGGCIKCVDTFRQNLPPAVAAGLGKTCPPVRGVAPSRAPRTELQLLDSFASLARRLGLLNICQPILVWQWGVVLALESFIAVAFIDRFRRWLSPVNL